MENNEIKELIIQKQEKYDEIIDEKKKKIIKKSIGFALCFAIGVIGSMGMAKTEEMYMFFINWFLKAAGTVISAFHFADIILMFIDKYKLKIKKEQLDELLKEINGEEKGKTL